MRQNRGIILNKDKLISKPPDRCGSNFPSHSTTWKLSAAITKSLTEYLLNHFLRPQLSSETRFTLILPFARISKWVLSRGFPTKKSFSFVVFPIIAITVYRTYSTLLYFPTLTLLSESANKQFGIYIIFKTAHSNHFPYDQIFF